MKMIEISIKTVTITKKDIRIVARKLTVNIELVQHLITIDCDVQAPYSVVPSAVDANLIPSTILTSSSLGFLSMEISTVLRICLHPAAPPTSISTTSFSRLGSRSISPFFCSSCAKKIISSSSLALLLAGQKVSKNLYTTFSSGLKYTKVQWLVRGIVVYFWEISQAGMLQLRPRYCGRHEQKSDCWRQVELFRQLWGDVDKEMGSRRVRRRKGVRQWWGMINNYKLLTNQCILIQI